MKILTSTCLTFAILLFGCEDRSEEPRILNDDTELCITIKNDLNISFPDFSLRVVEKLTEEILEDTLTNFDIKNCLTIPKNEIFKIDFQIITACEEFFFAREIGPFTVDESIEIFVESTYLTTSYKEKVFEGDKVITSQAELESFGSENYTKVNGHIKLSGINDLCPLKSLRTVSGNMKIGYIEYESPGGNVVYKYEYPNPDLNSLIGLNNLDSIGGSLIIQLTGLDSIGFFNLKTIGEHFIITNNENLKNFHGSVITNIGESIIIKYNNSLISTSNIIDSDVIFGSLEISDNINLPDLSGFNSVSTILGYLEIIGNNSLLNLYGLNQIKRVDRDIQISNNPLMINLEGLNNLSDFNSDLKISRNESLVDFTGLESLTTINSLWIDRNNSITDLNGFNNLTSINSLTVSVNPSLVYLNGLTNLNIISNKLDIYYSDNLLNLDIFSNLTEVPFVSILYNNSLIDFCGLKDVTIDQYYVGYNAYNPTQEQLRGDECKSN